MAEEFAPREGSERERRSYRADEGAPGSGRVLTTQQAVVLEGGETAEALVRLVSELLAEVRALRVGLSLVTGQELVGAGDPTGG